MISFKEYKCVVFLYLLGFWFVDTVRFRVRFVLENKVKKANDGSVAKDIAKIFISIPFNEKYDKPARKSNKKNIKMQTLSQSHGC